MVVFDSAPLDTPTPKIDIRGPLSSTGPMPPSAQVTPAPATPSTTERLADNILEYQKLAGNRLSQLVVDNLDMPLRLNAIRVVGATHTRSSFLVAILGPHLPDLPPPSYVGSGYTPPKETLKSVLNTAQLVQNHLEAFDIFKSVELGVEKSPSVLLEPEDVDLVIKVKESPRYFFRTATDVGDGEGNATATAKVRNAFGGGEMAEANISYGTRTKSAYQAKIDTPVNADPFTRAELAVFSAERDLNFYSSCQESSRGIQARLKTISLLGCHEICYEGILRKIGHLQPWSSMTIRESAGSTIKSSISHTFTRDTRDDPFVSTSGSFVKLRQELAGLGGDVSFAKAEGEYSYSRPLDANKSFSVGLRGGGMLPLGGQKTRFVDRFTLGGPTSVRMFGQNSIGPRDSRDYIGGDFYWAAGLSLLTPMFFKPQWPIKNHFFVNAGQLTSSTTINRLFAQPSVSIGWGLMYRHSIVRIEGNIGVPLLRTMSDGSMKGLQFGIGISFL